VSDNIQPMKNSRIALAVLLLPIGASADETFRCGNRIASSEMTVSELTAVCGQPNSRDSKTEEVKARNSNNGLMVKVGETTLETWIYDRGANPAMVVTIVDGRIKSITRRQ